MSMVEKQHRFLTDVALLIADITLNHPHISITGGELWRTEEQHQLNVKNGLSFADRSKHQDRLAIDLNFFVGGEYMGEMSKPAIMAILTPIGEYWESLGNVWGGRWTKPFDPWHFEARG